MPYISPNKREMLEEGFLSPKTAGELNFILSTIIKNFLGREYGYVDINEVIGVLECCKLEFYRRVAVPYEDQKILDNGDIYW